ncbi:MAG: hypothetical protein AAFS10_17970 [Myxococcota bacterium]
MSEHLTPEQHELLRKRLLRKGGQIAKKLADLLAGKDVQLVELAYEPVCSAQSSLSIVLNGI